MLPYRQWTATIRRHLKPTKKSVNTHAVTRTLSALLRAQCAHLYMNCERTHGGEPKKKKT